MGHGSKKMACEVCGNYVEGLEKDADRILEYFGNDFINLKKRKPPLSLCGLGKVTGKVEGSVLPSI
jgi:integrase